MASVGCGTHLANKLTKPIRGFAFFFLSAAGVLEELIAGLLISAASTVLDPPGSRPVVAVSPCVTVAALDLRAPLDIDALEVPGTPSIRDIVARVPAAEPPSNAIPLTPSGA